MANKRDVKRARVQGMRDLLYVYESCRNKDRQTEEEALESMQMYISFNEWECEQ